MLCDLVETGQVREGGNCTLLCLVNTNHAAYMKRSEIHVPSVYKPLQTL